MSHAGQLVGSLPLPTPAHGRPAAERLVSELLRVGVDTLFGIPGGTICPVFHAARGMRRIHPVHEGMAGYQALGWARATGLPGTLAVTSGPGLLNLTTPVAAAREDEIPLLVLAGEVSTGQAGTGALQDGREDGLGVLELFAPITKLARRAETADDILTLVREGLRVATTPPMGPVVLALPRDLLDEHVAKAPELPAPQPLVAPHDGDELAAALSAAGRPVLWLGVGARATGAGPAVLALAERHRIAVIADLESKGVFPESHPLSMGTMGPGTDGRAARVLAEADLVIGIGARLDPTSLAGERIDARLLHLEHAPRRARRHGTPVCGDLRTAVLALADAARVDAELLVARDRWARAFPPPSTRIAPLDRAPHEPGAVVRALQRHLPTARFTSDIGNHLLAAARHLCIDEPDGFFVSHGLAGMTSGIGAAMGIALADPGRPVVGICGDGGLLMAGAELATAARHQLNLVLAVFEDGAWGMVRDGMTAQLGDCEDADLPEVDLVGLARSLGLRAVRVTDARELGRALRERRDGPLMLVFPVGPSTDANPRLVRT